MHLFALWIIQVLDKENKMRKVYLQFKIHSEVKLLSHVWLFVTPWTVAYKTPLFMEFSRQEYWSGLPFPSPGVFPTQGSNPGLPHCRKTFYHLSHRELSQRTFQIWSPLLVVFGITYPSLPDEKVSFRQDKWLI